MGTPVNEEDLYRLYVRGSCNPKNKALGACAICHRLMMMLALKDVPAQVITKNESTAAEFKRKGLAVPFLEHKGFTSDELYTIEDYLLETKDGNNMKTENAQAKEVVAKSKAFMRFSFVIKNSDQRTHNDLVKHLDSELAKLNDFLDRNGTVFFDKDELTYVDCCILPQLLHIRVALGEFHGYQIPEKFEALCRYIKAGDGDEAFTQTKPEDAEIITFWKEKTGAILKK